MRIENEEKLDFSDVLIRPKRSSLKSRADVDITRTFRMPWSGEAWTGVPIIASNMTGVASLEMSNALNNHGALTALHKFHSLDSELFDHLNTNPNAFFTIGASQQDFENLKMVIKNVSRAPFAVCIDVANGYSEPFAKFVSKVRDAFPDIIIMAGNVTTAEMTEQLILSGADIVKCGIGPGSVCITRKVAGVGYPQLSAIIECSDAAHGLDGLVCADGGCQVPGDIAKAFGAGADFVMIGGMLAGHKECLDEKFDIKLVERSEPDWNNPIYSQVQSGLHDHKTTLMPGIKTEQYIQFYGMSSKAAMNNHYGGMAEYRASEGKKVLVKYKGSVEETLQEILGGLRSACTYVGARKLKELSKRTTFIKVRRQLNNMFGN